MILIVAAIPEELAAIERRFRGSPGIVLARTGDGRVRAEASLRALLARWQPDAWIGAGLAGAATAGVPAGTILVCRDAGDPAWAGRIAHRGGVLPARCVTVDRIASTPAEKVAAAGSPPPGEVVVLDMETDGWIAAGRSVSPSPPGLVIRVVSDALEEEIPAFVAAASSERGVDRRRIALHALTHPAAVGKLVAMRRRARSCAERLAEFLEALARREFDRP